MLGELQPFFFGSFLSGLFGWLISLLSIFLVLLILVQRGRGGGLTGALGGPGGQSAFGSKAGDMFTRITFATAGVWILLCALAMWSLGNARSVIATPSPTTVRETGTEPQPPGATSTVNPTSGLVAPGGGSALDAVTAPGIGATASPSGDAALNDGGALGSVADPAAAEAPEEQPVSPEVPAEGTTGTESGSESSSSSLDSTSSGE